jgi:hypothetical protein
MGGKEGSGSGSGRERRKEGGWGGVCWVLYDCLEAMLILIFTPFFIDSFSFPGLHFLKTHYSTPLQRPYVSQVSVIQNKERTGKSHSG